MPNAAAAEWILRLVTTSDRAGSTTGDLLEEASDRGELWFWFSVFTTFCSYLSGDLRHHWPQMIGLALLGFLEALVLANLVGQIWIPLWMAISPYEYGPNSTYIPPWAFYAMLATWRTAVPLLVGWDLARRSGRRELPAAVAFTSLQAALLVVQTFRLGSLVLRFERPYPYQINLLIDCCSTALFAITGAMLFRLRANMRGRSATPIGNRSETLLVYSGETLGQDLPTAGHSNREHDSTKDSVHTLKRNGVFLLLSCVLLALMRDRMPLQSFAHILGLPLSACAVYFLAMTVLHAGIALVQKLRPRRNGVS